MGEHATNASARALVLRAQAAYESHVGPVAALALGADEVAVLRAEALAGLGSTFAPPLVSAAEVAARRAEAEAEAEALRAEADRRDGPAYLFYPAAAAALVERQRGSARRLSHSARRGRRLLRSMSRQLDRRGVPADLRYVAVIESALDPHAESWAGAQGLWQFMPETAAEYGLDSLSVSDPVASTDAAARYLRWLSRQLRGDWQLALAAYNCGIGRVQRLAREFRAETGRQPTFWDLHDRLPTETQHYVPRFIAVAEAMGARGVRGRGEEGKRGRGEEGKGEEGKRGRGEEGRAAVEKFRATRPRPAGGERRQPDASTPPGTASATGQSWTHRGRPLSSGRGTG